MSNRFRKRPVVVEAVRWMNRKIICPPGPDWFAEAEERGRIKLHGDRLSIETPEGVMTANPGDWVIRGIACELYPCKSDIFALTYEPAGE